MTILCLKTTCFLGTPGALVSVSAVDRAAYFLYDGSRLTRDVMFNKMESYDQGCLRNGGQDGSGVFWVSNSFCTRQQLNHQKLGRYCYKENTYDKL